MDAFHEISTDRQIAFGVGPIPAMAIGGYADRNGFASPDSYAELRRVIRAMDAEYLEFQAERRKSAQQEAR